MRYTLIFTIILLVSLSACKTKNILVEEKGTIDFQHEKPDSVFVFDQDYQYSIRKDDKITISFWDHDELSVGSLYGIYNSNEVYGKWLMVDAEGNITVPKIGDVNVKDKTVIQVEKILRDTFAQWIVNPVIEVKVINKEVTILGELKNPGKYMVDRDHNSLLEIVSAAGGYDFYADMSKIKVIRQKGNQVKMINLDLTKTNDYLNRNIQIHPSDLILVPSRSNKEFDKRISTIIPIATTTTSAAILAGTIL